MPWVPGLFQASKMPESALPDAAVAYYDPASFLERSRRLSSPFRASPACNVADIACRTCVGAGVWTAMGVDPAARAISFGSRARHDLGSVFRDSSDCPHEANTRHGSKR